jgi:outer membrane protein TolC
MIAVNAACSEILVGRTQCELSASVDQRNEPLLAELNLVEARVNKRLALAQLYQALGGGWQQ